MIRKYSLLIVEHRAYKENLEQFPEQLILIDMCIKLKLMSCLLLFPFQILAKTLMRNG